MENENKIELNAETIKKLVSENPSVIAQFAMTTMLGIVVGVMRDSGMAEQEIRAAFETAIAS